jgi:hypothetical protein
MYCEDAGEATLPEQLLADICRVFAELRVDRISSNDLCEQLGDLESRPWANLNDGFRLSPNKLAILLRPFDIKPHGIRIGLTTPKGYLLRDFEDAFARYLPPKRNNATDEVEQRFEPYIRDEAAPMLRCCGSKPHQGIRKFGERFPDNRGPV